MGIKVFTLCNKETLDYVSFYNIPSLCTYVWGLEFDRFIISIMTPKGYSSMNLDMLPKDIDSLELFLSMFE